MELASMNGVAHLGFEELLSMPMPGHPTSHGDAYPATDNWHAGRCQDVWALAAALEDVVPVQLHRAAQPQFTQQPRLLSPGAAPAGGLLPAASVSAQQALRSGGQSGTAIFDLSSPAVVPQMGSTAMMMAPWEQQQQQLPVMVSGLQAAMQLQLQPQAQQPACSSFGAAYAAQHNMAGSQPQRRRQHVPAVGKQLVSAVFQVAHDLLVEDAIFSHGNKRPGICMAGSCDSSGDTFDGLAPSARRTRSCGAGDACWGMSEGPAAGTAWAPPVPNSTSCAAAGAAAFASADSNAQQRRFVAAARGARPSQTVPNLQLWQQQQQQQAVTGSWLPGAVVPAGAAGMAAFVQRLPC